MIFLFRFDVTDKGMDFILNEEIAKDMYHESEIRRSPIKRRTMVDHSSIFIKKFD
ncbi:hypothetical protein [Bacillus cereus]|uniref:hypothetical protein n=1 Tax=Bacillus cereus TaxID=1396 RepID=UPI0015CF77DC|nr:hypothetical protein [Bacillus cereus]